LDSRLRLIGNGYSRKRLNAPQKIWIPLKAELRKRMNFSGIAGIVHGKHSGSCARGPRQASPAINYRDRRPAIPELQRESQADQPGADQQDIGGAD
jgi:hypothetical protein